MTGADDGLEHVRLRLTAGAPVARARVPERAARALAVAAAAGAPALPALDAAVAAADDLARRDRAVAVATAQARTVMAGLIALPLLAVPGLGALTGMTLWRFYVTPAGIAVAVVAASLVGAGVLIAHRMIAAVGRVRAPMPPLAVGAAAGAVSVLLIWPPVAVAIAIAVTWWQQRRRTPPVAAGADEVAELVAAALAGGLSHGAALRLVAPRLPQYTTDLLGGALALELGLTPRLPAPLDRVGMVLSDAATLGAPAVPALRRVARQLREDEMARVLAAAERLPAMLTFPTALCLLPACLLLVGAPLVAEGLRAAMG